MAMLKSIKAKTRGGVQEGIFVQGTGHVYSEREQMLADIILCLAKDWEGQH